MEIKEILLFLTAGEPSAGLLALSARLAREYGASVKGACLHAEPQLPVADSFAVGGAAIRDVIDHHAQAVRRMIAPTEAAFRGALADLATSASWSVLGSTMLWPLSGRQPPLADLMILRRPAADDQPGHELATTVALAGGTPVLLVPETGEAPAVFDRVVLAWNGSPQARRAMSDGLVFLKRASAVRVLIVGDRVDQAEEAELIRHLASHGVAAELRSVKKSHGSTGKTILRECGVLGANLLVMGAYGRSETAERLLGGATRTALCHAQLPVLMSH